MNSWSKEWILATKKNDLITQLNELGASLHTKGLGSVSFKQDTDDSYLLIIKRSLVWGTACRKEIIGKISFLQSNNSLVLNTNLDIASPYKHVNLTTQKTWLLGVICFLSWVGLVISEFFYEDAVYITPFLLISFFLSCLYLVFAFQKSMFIKEKFRTVINVFLNKFGQ